jgi:cytochrome c biogenesis protein CcmG/thiol:disulfide interchange protein DsbE
MQSIAANCCWHSPLLSLTRLKITIMIIGGLLYTAAQANDLEIGQPAPSLKLHTLNGQLIDTRTLLGKVVIVVYWASWCGPCQKELPILSAYYDGHENQGLQVLALSLDDVTNMDTVRKLAHNLKFPVGLADSPWQGGYGRIWHVPVSFVIDKKGRLAYNGWEDKQPGWTAEKLQTVIDPLLQ